MGNKFNEATKELLDNCIKNNQCILSIDYVDGVGVIEQDSGSPTTIHYNRQTNNWK